MVSNRNLQTSRGLFSGAKLLSGSVPLSVYDPVDGDPISNDSPKMIQTANLKGAVLARSQPSGNPHRSGKSVAG